MSNILFRMKLYKYENIIFVNNIIQSITALMIYFQI